MPPIPASKLTELLLSRRRLFEKIVQHVASKKIQNSIQATGDRMAVTPQQFGMQVGKTMGKQAFLGPGLLGAGLGAVTSPDGHRMEGAGRGAAKATGTTLGAVAGIPAGILAAMMLMKGKRLPVPRGGIKIPRRFDMNQRNRENLGKLIASVGMGAPAGAVVGGGAGYAGTSAMLGKPSWDQPKTASLMSVLGGGLGAGVGGLAGGAGGGLLGALAGGAMGGGPGAGIGLLSGGAMGMGAGAHLGGNIGASIGKKKKKDDESESEESAEKEEKADEGEEEVKKSAAAVLAQLRKNAGDTVGFLHPHAHDFRKDTPGPRPMTGAAGTMKRVGNQMAQTSPAVAGVLPQLAGKNIAAAAPAVEAAGNKLTVGEKNMRPAATGGVNMFGVMPALAGNLGRFLGGR